MPKSYIAPAWEDTGSIDMRPSQDGALGNVAASDFDTWWASDDVQANMDIINAKYPEFEPRDPNTWPGRFHTADPTSWYLLFD